MFIKGAVLADIICSYLLKLKFISWIMLLTPMYFKDTIMTFLLASNI